MPACCYCGESIPPEPPPYELAPGLALCADCRAAGPFFQWPQTGIEGALWLSPVLRIRAQGNIPGIVTSAQDEHGRPVQDLPPGVTAAIPEGVKVPAKDYRIMHCTARPLSDDRAL